MVNEKMESGMGIEEIYKKINTFGTESIKLNYLNSLEPRIGLTKPLTKNSFYEILGNLYEKENYFSMAIESYKKAGRNKKAISIADEALVNTKSCGGLEYLSKFYDSIEKSEKARQSLEKAGDYALEQYPENEGIAAKYYERAGNYKKSTAAWKKQAENYEKNGWYDQAGDAYKKAGLEHKANESYIKEGDSYPRGGLNFEYSEKAYLKANLSEQDWIKLADRALKHNSLDCAIRFLRRGGAKKEDFVLAGNNLIQMIEDEEKRGDDRADWVKNLFPRSSWKPFSFVEVLYKMGNATKKEWSNLEDLKTRYKH